jgi:hypothetical protein
MVLLPLVNQRKKTRTEEEDEEEIASIQEDKSWKERGKKKGKIFKKGQFRYHLYLPSRSDVLAPKKIEWWQLH